ncbi:MAG: hypothetical protein AABZ53_03370 [Planctomycetota bacterium]
MSEQETPNPGFRLDLLDQTAPPALGSTGGEPGRQGVAGAPSLQVYFRCANAYTRVFRRPESQAYLARCPKCGKSMRFAVGPGGTSTRFFTVSC